MLRFTHTDGVQAYPSTFGAPPGPTYETTTTMAQRRSTQADQTAIDGTETEALDLTAAQKRKLHTHGNTYCDQLAQMQAWDSARKNTKPKLDAVLAELELESYVLPSGHTVKRSPGAHKITVKFAKNDEGGVDEVEVEQIEVG